MYLYTNSVFGCGQIHVAVSNSEHQAWVFQLPRVRVGSFPLKSNKQSLCSKPRNHGVNSIPRAGGTYTVTCPEVAHFEDSSDFYKCLSVMELNFLFLQPIDSRSILWSPAEAAFYPLLCQSPSDTQHSLSAPRQHSLAFQKMLNFRW